MLQMEIWRTIIHPEDKNLFNQWWEYLCNLPVKYKKLWLGAVTAARKCGNCTRDIEAGGVQIPGNLQRVHR